MPLAPNQIGNLVAAALQQMPSERLASADRFILFVLCPIDDKQTAVVMLGNNTAHMPDDLVLVRDVVCGYIDDTNAVGN